MHTAVLQAFIYQLAKYKKDPMKNDREIAERREWERNKRRERKDNTTTERSSDFLEDFMSSWARI